MLGGDENANSGCRRVLVNTFFIKIIKDPPWTPRHNETSYVARLLSKSGKCPRQDAKLINKSGPPNPPLDSSLLHSLSSFQRRFAFFHLCFVPVIHA
jgi:hypothetical protein